MDGGSFQDRAHVTELVQPASFQIGSAEMLDIHHILQ